MNRMQTVQKFTLTALVMAMLSLTLSAPATAAPSVGWLSLWYSRVGCAYTYTVRRLARHIVRISALLLLFFGLPSPARAQVTSVNGKIAYVVCESVNFDSQCDIWVMNADGTGQTNVTNTPDLSEQNPVWSADGTKIAFIEGTQGFNYLKVIDLGIDGNGRTVTTVTTEPSVQWGPTWSPGGTQIALVREVPGVVMTLQFDIIVVNVDGSGETNITNSDFMELDPAWSPDGSKIAFAGVRLLSNLGAELGIVTVNPDGSGEQILTAGDPGTPRADGLDNDRAPAWSPDSSKLVFMSEAQYPFGCCGPWQIWAVNRDGTGVTNLTNDDTVYEMGPSWSPDGTQVLFYRAYRFVGPENDGLYTMPAPTTLPLAVATLSSTATRLAAAASSATLLAAGASDADWGRDPSAPPPNPAYTLSVSITLQNKGAGGTVASDLKGINCGRDCSERYAAGTLVTLTAAPRRNSAFDGWSGACAQISDAVCLVTMNDVKTVTAKFRRSR